jgi:hypothetical protein
METTLNSPAVNFFPQVAEGKVDRAITAVQSGRIKFQGSYWPAQFFDTNCQATALPNDVVTVVARRSITLLVVPAGHALPTQPQNSTSTYPQKVLAGLTQLFRLEGKEKVRAIAH